MASVTVQMGTAGGNATAAAVVAAATAAALSATAAESSGATSGIESDFTYTDNEIPMTGTLEGSPTVEEALFNWRRDSDNVLDRPTGTVTISGNAT